MTKCELTALDMTLMVDRAVKPQTKHKLLSCFIEIPIFNANSIDPNQTPHSMASDLGLHCLPMLLLWDVKLKWVNN